MKNAIDPEVHLLLDRISRLSRARASLHDLGVECGALDPILDEMTQRLRELSAPGRVAHPAQVGDRTPANADIYHGASAA